MKRKRKRLAGVATALLALVITACSGPYAVLTKASQQEVPVYETGSTLMVPLMAEWGYGFHQAYPQGSLVPAGSNSGTGVNWAGLGKASFGGSDAYLSALQHLEFPGLLNIPLAVAALDVNYNVKGLHQPLRLSGKVVAQMYRGVITHWNDPRIARLNPGVHLPSLPVVTEHRSDSSGSSFLFTSWLHAQDSALWPSKLVSTSPAWPHVSGQLAEHGSSNQKSACAVTRGCIGYIGVSYQTEINLAGLGTAALQNAAGFFRTPTPQAMRLALKEFYLTTPASGTQSLINSRYGYPIINYEYAMVLKHQQTTELAKSIRNVLTWGLTKGSAPRYLGSVGFVPLPPNVQTIALNLVNSVR